MQSPLSVSRRAFLRRSTAAAALSSLGFPAILRAETARKTIGPASAAKPNLIFMVSDGMSAGLLPIADQLSTWIHDRPSRWVELMRKPATEAYTGFMDMSSATGAVTDSAAASSSWSTGQRIYNGALNFTPDRERPNPIFQRARAAGIRTAAVTTARITHATPAGFLVNMPSRNDEDAIAEAYLTQTADILLGGGTEHFDPNIRTDTKDMFATFAEAGFAVLRDRNALGTAPIDKPWLGTFGQDHLPYSIDLTHNKALRAKVPSLNEMTEAALRKLSALDQRFFMQIEAARVDHGAHANDAPASIYDQLEFDATLATVLDFIARNPNTILVVTTDHGNANPALNGFGPAYSDTNAGLRRLLNAKASYTTLVPMLASAEPTERAALVASATGVELAPEDLLNLDRVLDGSYQHLFRAKKGPTQRFAEIMANYTGIGWTGSTHTADYSPLTIIDPRRPNLPQHLLNTDLHQYLAKLI